MQGTTSPVCLIIAALISSSCAHDAGAVRGRRPVVLVAFGDSFGAEAPESAGGRPVTPAGVRVGDWTGTPTKVERGKSLTISYDPGVSSPVTLKAVAKKPNPARIAEDTIALQVTAGVPRQTATWTPPMEWTEFELTNGGDRHLVTVEGHPIDRFASVPLVARKGTNVDLRFEGESSDQTLVVDVDGGTPDKVSLAKLKDGVYVLKNWSPGDSTVTLQHRDSADHKIRVVDELPSMFRDTADRHIRGKDLAVKFRSRDHTADSVEATLQFSQPGGEEKNQTLKLQRVAGTQDEFAASQTVPLDWEYLRLTERSSTPHMVALVDADRGPDYADNFFMVHVGAVSLSPFKINKVPGTSGAGAQFNLDESGSREVSGYVETLFRHRKAWLTADQEFSMFEERHWYKPDDIEMRLGANFAGSDTSASSVAGSGDFYGEVSAGWSFPGPPTNRVGTEGAYALNLEIMAGFNTDRGAQDLHGYYMFGPNLVIGVPFGQEAKDKTPRMIELQLGGFLGKADFPNFVDETTPAIMNNRGFPSFGVKTAVGIRADFRLPFGETSYLVFTGRVFDQLHSTHDVHPWSLMIGVSVPIKSIGTALLGTGK